VGEGEVEEGEGEATVNNWLVSHKCYFTVISPGKDWITTPIT